MIFAGFKEAFTILIDKTEITFQVDVETESLRFAGFDKLFLKVFQFFHRTGDRAIRIGDKLSAEVTVTNTGSRDGAETVHWFISDPYCSITRPVKELKHFEKQLIKAGETKTFRFDIDMERDFGFVNEDGKRFLEAGEYHILVQGQTVKIELID